jgi:hypothetical protein
VSDIRVGVIGVGIMGAGHARYITDSVDGAVVTAFFDLDAARMDALANELSAKSGATINKHSSVADLINDSTVDAVIICSPDGLHPEHLELCVKAGKPTLCEKPLAPRLEDAKKMWATEQSSSNKEAVLGLINDQSIPKDQKINILSTYATSGYLSTDLKNKYVQRVASITKGETHLDDSSQDTNVNLVPAKMADVQTRKEDYSKERDIQEYQIS